MAIYFKFFELVWMHRGAINCRVHVFNKVIYIFFGSLRHVQYIFDYIIYSDILLYCLLYSLSAFSCLSLYDLCTERERLIPIVFKVLWTPVAAVPRTSAEFRITPCPDLEEFLEECEDLSTLSLSPGAAFESTLVANFNQKGVERVEVVSSVHIFTTLWERESVRACACCSLAKPDRACDPHVPQTIGSSAEWWCNSSVFELACVRDKEGDNVERGNDNPEWHSCCPALPLRPSYIWQMMSSGRSRLRGSRADLYSDLPVLGVSFDFHNTFSQLTAETWSFSLWTVCLLNAHVLYKKINKKCFWISKRSVWDLMTF